MPAGRLAIQGGGSPGGGAGSGTPGLSPSRMKAGMSCSTGSPSSRSNSSQSAFSAGLRSQFPAQAGSSSARLATRSGLAAANASEAAPPPEYPTR